MSLRKDIEKTVKLKEFHRSVEQLLTPEDRDYLFYAMKEYNTYRSVAKLMLALNSCLDTPEKLDLLLYIRELIPKHDQKKFDSLAPYNRMAHPASPKREIRSQELGDESSAGVQLDAIRTLALHRPKGISLGFSIRGGREHNLGIYVSHVDSLSLAERCGLLVGDQIIDVNGISFESITHSSAVLVLKSHDDLKVVVRSIGRIPGQKISKNSFIWVDVSGNLIPNGGTTDSIEGRAAGDRLLASTDRHKVVLHASKKKDLGFSIRGGSEYSLGIYISCVDKDSPAEESGLRVGDQILDVNGHSFINTLHQEAVTILRAYPTLIMTLKSLGRLPALPVPKLFQPNSSSNSERKEEGSAQTTTKGPTLTRKSLSPMQEEISMHRSDLALYKHQSQVTQGSRQAKVKRSSSLLTAAKGPPNAYRRHNQGYRSPNVAGPPPIRPKPRHSSMHVEQPSTLPRAKKAVVVSPLATKGTRAVSPLATTATSVRARRSSPEEYIPTPVVSFRPRRVASESSIEKEQQTDKADSKFFEYGLGSQMMLSSATTIKARDLMVDRARRLISEAEVQTLLEKLRMYERSREIGQLVEFLMTMLNTPDKLQLLTDVRSLLHPSDLVQFDELVSPHEVEALHRRASLHMDEDHAGRKSLQRDSTDDTNEFQPSELGAYGALTANSVLYKASSTDDGLRAMQSKESEEEKGEEMGFIQQPPYGNFSSNPVIIELPKTGPSIGLAIGGGIDTTRSEITIMEVKEGGAAHNNGFLKPGFEIVEVDGVRVKGMTHDEAARTMAQAFSTEKPTIELTVIPK